MLQELAEDRPAELKDFAVTLRSLGRDLLTEGALDPNRMSGEEMRQTVKDLLARAGRADERRISQCRPRRRSVLGHRRGGRPDLLERLSLSAAVRASRQRLTTPEFNRFR